MNAGTGPTLLGAIYLNLCILTTSALLVGLTFRMTSRRLASVAKAAVFATTSVTLFLHTFPAGPHLFVDLRLVPVALAAYRLGPVWALVTALPVLLYRISLGGPALPGAVAHLALVLLAASVLRKRDVIPSLSPLENARRALLIFGLPTLTIFPTFAHSNLPVTAAIVPYLLVVTGSVLGFVLWYAIVRLMAQTFERAARFEEAASLDVLTGLPNRLAFEREAAPAAPGRYLLFLDLDHFKAVNDQHGHDTGDLVLRAAGEAIQRLTAGQGRTYRLGGEEFAVRLLSSDDRSAQVLADRLRRSLPGQVAVALGRSDLRVTMSGGLVPDGPDALNLADRLLYAAKEHGRNRILDAWQHPNVPASHSPLNGSSPAVATLRSVLRFIGGNDSSDTGPNLQALLDAAIACVPGAEAGSLTIRTGDHSVVAVQSGYDDGLIGTRHTVRQMMNWHGTPEAWRAGKPRVLNGEALRARSRASHVDDAATQRRLQDAGRQDDLKSNLLLPIRVQGDIHAELNLDNLTLEDAFTPESLEVAEEFGLWAAAILSASQRVQQAQSSQDAAFLTLGVALEARDMETHGHTRRVIALSEALGTALDLDAADLQLLRQGAALHDLGKLLVPDHILLKPGKLTAEEWTVMQTHAERGADLAGHLSGLLPGVLDIIRHHHERWDGNGYPARLAGEDIPLLARIFSVCDVFDALTSERPYKAAWSVQEALNEIASQAGRQFDPAAVQAFLTLHTAHPPLDGGPDLLAAGD